MSYESREFIRRRRKITEEWVRLHPEGITVENHEQAKEFFKRRERELKEVANE